MITNIGFQFKWVLIYSKCATTKVKKLAAGYVSQLTMRLKSGSRKAVCLSIGAISLSVTSLISMSISWEASTIVHMKYATQSSDLLLPDRIGNRSKIRCRNRKIMRNHVLLAILFMCSQILNKIFLG